MDEEVDCDQYADKTLEQLMDAAGRARTDKAYEELVRIENAVYKLFDDVGGKRPVEIRFAVHSGLSWPELFSEYNKRVFGTRWPPGMSRSKAAI